jgi:hypothetical protein
VNARSLYDGMLTISVPFEKYDMGDRNMSEKEHPKTIITFDSPSKASTPTISITGVTADYVKRPEKIRQLMEILDLPEGTKARIISSVEDVIVR